MATQNDFTAEEWTLLLEAPMLAGMAVSVAEPSGLFGMLKESFATGKLLVQAKADAGANELVRAVAAAYETADGRGFLGFGGVQVSEAEKATLAEISAALA